jgi:hypothetical protein
MSSVDALSFVGRRRTGRPRSFWQVRRLSAGRHDLAELGRELGDEFIAFMEKYPGRTYLVDKIVQWMPKPMGPVEIAFLARVRQLGDSSTEENSVED